VKPRILVVDDEPEAVELVEFNLKQAGYAVTTAADGAEALKKARSQTPDLIVLDVMLPEMDGFEICKTLRLDATTAKVPIIMLTAKAAEIDRVLGLELGADDYLTKPFSPRELLLRVKKILARFQTEEKPKEQLRFDELMIDLPRHIASWKGKPIELTATEFKLLTMLAQRAGRVQSRDQLLRDVWEYDSLIDTRTCAGFAKNLARPQSIWTRCAAWGIGLWNKFFRPQIFTDETRLNGMRRKNGGFVR